MPPHEHWPPGQLEGKVGAGLLRLQATKRVLDCPAPLQVIKPLRAAVADAVRAVLRGRKCSAQSLGGVPVVASACKLINGVVAHFVVSKSGVVVCSTERHRKASWHEQPGVKCSWPNWAGVRVSFTCAAENGRRPLSGCSVGKRGASRRWTVV